VTSRSAPGVDQAGWRPSEVQLERLALKRRQRMRGSLLATVSALVFFGVLVVVVVSSPGWPTVQATFFDWDVAVEVFPEVLEGFWLNVRLFLIAEPLILVLGLTVALARVSRSPVLFPVRLLAIGYTDLFRGIPTILVLLLFCFGIPALGLQGVTTSLFWLALVALVLSYGAYVAEVFRAGIESVHPSQLSSATALGLSSGQTLRHVVVPQAVRRVMPPLLNDFVALQKDVGLISVLGAVDAIRAAQIESARTFNFTPYVVAALLFVLLAVPTGRIADALAARAARRQGVA
jgi:polar amino acid transport system permease protein